MDIKHVVSVSGGKDSTATLLIALEHCAHDSVVPIFCDTGNEHELVYGYLDYLESALSIKITRLKADFSEQLEVHRQRLLAIANGAPDYHPQAKYLWTPETAARAAAVMFPTGNQFLDLCMLKGLFPSHSRQFCTESLKRDLAVEFQLDLVEAEHSVITWQGIRRNESERRKHAKKIERIGPRIWAFRPLVEWTAEQVFAYAEKRGINHNPLYRMGMNRVGCMPCVNVSKSELREIGVRFPDHIARIADWEQRVGQASRMSKACFLHATKPQGIYERVEWAKTTYGGKQYDLLTDSIDTQACASAYGLCE